MALELGFLLKLNLQSTTCIYMYLRTITNFFSVAERKVA